MSPFNPSALWWYSTRLHRRRLRALARVLKAVNYFVFKSILPPECELAGPVTLYHRGLGVVIHPAVSFGRNVHVAHGVTITTSDWDSRERRVHIGDGARIGMGSVINGKAGRVTTIGRNVLIGANAVVIDDVSEGATVFAPLGEVKRSERS